MPAYLTLFWLCSTIDNEPGVGDALVNFNREEIFLQTKFTSPSGQDPETCPYDQNLPLEQQIITSFNVSCTKDENLRTIC